MEWLKRMKFKQVHVQNAYIIYSEAIQKVKLETEVTELSEKVHGECKKQGQFKILLINTVNRLWYLPI